VEQYVPLPNRPLVNFAHCGTLKDWSVGVANRKRRPVKWPAEWIRPCGKSPDCRSLTLRIKLSMNPVYQLMSGKTAAAKNFRRVRKAAGDPSTLTNAVLRVRNEAFIERFLGPSANGFIGSDGLSHEVPLTRQCRAQTAA
jgi:hypothetical protein